jgi:hypothetical protein
LEPRALSSRRAGCIPAWSLYVKDGKLKLAYNYLGNVTAIAAAERLPEGSVTVGYDFIYDGGQPGSGGTGSILINGKQMATARIERTIPFLFGAETADVGRTYIRPSAPTTRRATTSSPELSIR